MNRFRRLFLPAVLACFLLSLGAPIVGDPVYGTGGESLLLHASRLIVPREKKPAVDITAPLPERFGEWRDAV